MLIRSNVNRKSLKTMLDELYRVNKIGDIKLITSAAMFDTRILCSLCIFTYSCFCFSHDALFSVSRKFAFGKDTFRDESEMFYFPNFMFTLSVMAIVVVGVRFI
jgi:hypothetical protein